MRSREGKLRFRMIECWQVCPSLYRVACRAFHWLPGAVFRCHLHNEFLSMRILVAGGTSRIVEMIRDNVARLPSHPYRMALVASDRHMRTLEREARLFMKRDRKCGWTETFDRVAPFALPVVRRRSELPGVLILVAIGAFRERNLVASGLACWRMAVIAR